MITVDTTTSAALPSEQRPRAASLADVKHPLPGTAYNFTLLDTFLDLLARTSIFVDLCFIYIYIFVLKIEGTDGVVDTGHYPTSAPPLPSRLYSPIQSMLTCACRMGTVN